MTGWCQRGEFMTLPHYFKSNGYITGGAGKIFHPDACGTPSEVQENRSHMIIPKCNYSHPQGDDGNAWTLPYFPPTHRTQGWDADCVQYGILCVKLHSVLTTLDFILAGNAGFCTKMMY